MRLATLTFLLFLTAASLMAATTEAIIAGTFQTTIEAKQRIEALEWYLQQDPKTDALQRNNAFAYDVRSTAWDYHAVILDFRDDDVRQSVLETIRKLHPDANLTAGGEILAGTFKTKEEAEQRIEALEWYLKQDTLSSRLQQEHAFSTAVGGGAERYLVVMQDFNSSEALQTVLQSIKKLHPEAYTVTDPNTIPPYVAETAAPQSAKAPQKPKAPQPKETAKAVQPKAPVKAAAVTPAKTPVGTEAPAAPEVTAAAPAPEPVPAAQPAAPETPAETPAATAETAQTPLPAAEPEPVPQNAQVDIPEPPTVAPSPSAHFQRTTPFEVSDTSESSDDSMLSSVLTLLLTELLLGGAALLLFFRKRPL